MRQRWLEAFPEGFPGSWVVPEPSVVWVAAFLAVLGLAMRNAQKVSLDTRIMYWAGVWGLMGALSGGHVLHVFGVPKTLLHDPWLLVRFLEGGKGVFGALFGACCFGWLYLRWRQVSFLAYADAAVPAIAFGYAVARFGCFLNGDDFGTLSEVPWAVRFAYSTAAFSSHVAAGWVEAQDTLSLPVHPAQLYHAATGVVLFVFLRRGQGQRPGSRLAVAVASYGAMRFCLQYVRGDTTAVLGPLDQSQILSLAFLVGGGLWWWQQEPV
jgi:phosphatidylglycerol---prolipoprotein diacylglyceryl transferase